jgi:hypothetical protein
MGARPIRSSPIAHFYVFPQNTCLIFAKDINLKTETKYGPYQFWVLSGYRRNPILIEDKPRNF